MFPIQEPISTSRWLLVLTYNVYRNNEAIPRLMPYSVSYIIEMTVSQASPLPTLHQPYPPLVQ